MPLSKSLITSVHLGPPDVALEAAVCFDQFDSLVGGQSLRSLVLANLASALDGARKILVAKGDAASTAVASLFPVPPQEVQTAGLCGPDGREHMGAWLVPIVAPQTVLAQLHVLPDLKLFAFQFSSAAVATFFAAGWEALTAQNHRLNDSGKPDPNGLLELKEPPTLTSPDAHTIELTVSGTYHYTLPIGKIHIPIDVDFTFVNTETLSASPLGIQVSSQQHIELDRGPIDTALAGAFFVSLFGGVFSGPTFAMIYSLVESHVSAATNKAGLPVKIAGLVAPMFPQVVLIPGTTSKLLITYDDVTADVASGGAGIVASGVARPSVVPRTPQVFVQGSATIVVNRAVTQATAISAVYNLAGTDMRVELDGAGDVKAPSSVAWGGGVVASPSALSTAINFNIGTAAAGHTLTRVVTATLTDADGQMQSASRTVSIQIVNQPLPHPPTGGPKPGRTLGN